jgi:hypothetical protein
MALPKRGRKMQLKQKINRGKLTAAILLAGCFMLTTANAGMAEGTKVKLDFVKIQQALKGGTASGGTAAPAPGMNVSQMAAKMSARMPANIPGNALAPVGNGMQAGSPVTGTMGPDVSQMIKNTMGGDFVSSDVMGEMQKKIMAENMGSMQEGIQASVMKSIQGSVQQTATDSLTK